MPPAMPVGLFVCGRLGLGLALKRTPKLSVYGGLGLGLALNPTPNP